MKPGISINEDRTRVTYNLPVPLGGTVYAMSTDCGDFCGLTPELHGIYCSMRAPCHTVRRKSEKVVLMESNMSDILKGWNERFFLTEEEADAAAEKLVITHREWIAAHGIELDGNGRPLRCDEKKEN